MSDPPTRSAIVEALNDLGEYDRLTYEQRTSWDKPYPSEFVANRLEVLRRDQLWLWAFLTVMLAGIALVFAGIQLDWPGMDFATGFMFMVLPAAGIGIRRLVHNAKVEQPYALLHQLDDAPESADAPSAETT